MHYMVSGFRQAQTALAPMEKQAGFLSEMGAKYFPGLLQGVGTTAAGVGGLFGLGSLAHSAAKIHGAVTDSAALAKLKVLAGKEGKAWTDARKAALAEGRQFTQARPQSLTDYATAVKARRLQERGVRTAPAVYTPRRLDAAGKRVGKQTLVTPAQYRPATVQDAIPLAKPYLSNGAQWGVLAGGLAGGGKMVKNYLTRRASMKMVKNVALPVGVVGGGILAANALRPRDRG